MMMTMARIRTLWIWIVIDFYVMFTPKTDQQKTKDGAFRCTKFGKKTSDKREK